MEKQSLHAWLIFIIVFLAILAPKIRAFTDVQDVTALQDLYWNLNFPPLKGWGSEIVADPCDELWSGVSCFGSSVIYLKLRGLNLNGTLGYLLSNLRNLKQMDVSFNNIWGPIPDELPPNATHINLACNNFNHTMPAALSNMKHLRHLNLSHNLLSGNLGNVFVSMGSLREMDLSFNSFSGDLPSSFGSLKNLSALYLQNNNLTGSVTYLSELPLIDLNIQNNDFSGIIPEHFESIPNLWIGGNRFHTDDSPPWHFPLDRVPIEQNINSPPTSQSSAIESNPIIERYESKKKKKKNVGPGGISFIVGGGTLVASCVAIYISVRVHKSRSRQLQDDATAYTLPVSTATDSYATAAEQSPQFVTFRSPIMDQKRMPPIYHSRVEKNTRRKSFTRRHGVPVKAKLYSVADLQSATNSFSEANLLGEGSLGSVYKAEFPDGQVLAVKNVNTVSLSFQEEEQFLDVVWTVSRLRHTNVVPLLGYCVEHGQHLLVYEYVRNLSLEDALHSGDYKPLSWGLRLQIALGVAQALNYLHSTFSPPLAHSDLKAANILLDEQLTPRVCDCGLAILRPLTTNKVKIKAAEIAIGDTGYIAPEHGRSGVDNRKSDTYAFGVLLLELLTGRKPFDSLRPREEQSLVKWASSRLHDSECLEHMVDQGIKRMVSSRNLSRFADIVSLCIQPVKEFRPPMSEVVESLQCLLQKVNMESGGNRAETGGTEIDDKSFLSTNTRFICSPATSDSSTE